jgi:hypothetical protein
VRFELSVFVVICTELPFQHPRDITSMASTPSEPTTTARLVGDRKVSV